MPAPNEMPNVDQLATVVATYMGAYQQFHEETTSCPVTINDHPIKNRWAGAVSRVYVEDIHDTYYCFCPLGLLAYVRRGDELFDPYNESISISHHNRALPLNGHEAFELIFDREPVEGTDDDKYVAEFMKFMNSIDRSPRNHDGTLNQRRRALTSRLSKLFGLDEHELIAAVEAKCAPNPCAETTA